METVFVVMKRDLNSDTGSHLRVVFSTMEKAIAYRASFFDDKSLYEAIYIIETLVN